MLFRQFSSLGLFLTEKSLRLRFAVQTYFQILITKYLSRYYRQFLQISEKVLRLWVSKYYHNVLG